MERQFNLFHFEETLILLDQSVLRLRQDRHKGIFIKVFKCCNNRQTADEFRNETEFQKIFRLQLGKQFADTPVFRRLDPGLEADGGLRTAIGNDLVKASKCAAANEQNVGRVHLQELLLRVLAAALRRNRGNSAFHDLQKRLLNALTRDITGDRRIVRLTADLVDLIDIDDAALRTFDIVVSRLKQLQDDVLNIFTNVTGLGQGRGIGHRERHIQDPGERLRQQRLAATGRPYQEDVGFRQFHIVVLRRVVEAFVMVVNGDRQNFLRTALPDHIVIENVANFLRGRDTVPRLHQRGLVLLANDIHAQLDTFIANENSRAGDQLANLVLALAAKGAVERILGIAAAGLGHVVNLAFVGSSPLIFPVGA